MLWCCRLCMDVFKYAGKKRITSLWWVADIRYFSFIHVCKSCCFLLKSLSFTCCRLLKNCALLHDWSCYENCFISCLYQCYVLWCGSIISDSRFAAINPMRKPMTSRGSNCLLASDMQANGSAGMSVGRLIHSFIHLFYFLEMMYLLSLLYCHCLTRLLSHPSSACRAYNSWPWGHSHSPVSQDKSFSDFIIKVTFNYT